MNKLSEIDSYNFEINFNTNNSFYNISHLEYNYKIPIVFKNL